MIKLILSDLDGTLLNTNGSLDIEAFKPLLKKMTEKKITFAAVTGKQVQRVEELFQELSKDIWIVGDSASRIQHAGKIVYARTIINQEGQQIIKDLLSAQPEQVIIPCTSKYAYVLNSYSDKEKENIRDSYAKLKFIDSFEEINSDFLKISAMDLTMKTDQTLKKISSLSDRYFVVAVDSIWIDVTAHDVHKGTTVAALQSMLGISKEETIAFGDGYNDLELFNQAKISYAMANAFPNVKKKASHLAPSNNEQGVFKVLEAIL